MKLLACVLLVALPLLAGATFGRGLRWMAGGRAVHRASLVAMLLLPPFLCVTFVKIVPIVGSFDAGLEGLLLGIGAAWTGHEAFASRWAMWLCGSTFIAGLLLLEIGCRIFLPPPPAFSDVPLHFFLTTDDWDTLSGAVGGVRDSLDAACEIIYGPDGSRGPHASAIRGDILTPARYVPRPESGPRILHVGDSLTFGENVSRTETFEAELERLEPGFVQVNGGVSGMAPDEYYAILSRWIDRDRFDGVVMYLYEGNDLLLDLRHRCSGWDSLLVYENGTARLRYARQSARPTLEGRRDGWLVSPPPFLLRALVGHSSMASYACAAINDLRRVSYSPNESRELRVAHVKAVLRASRDLLAARHIPFTVVVFPNMGCRDDPDTLGLRAELLAAGQSLGIRTLDSFPLITAAIARGETMIQKDGVHLTARGNVLVAAWLHEQLFSGPGAPGYRHGERP